jgi:hypothetical protein
MAPEHWKDEPEEHDFPSAFNYLTLLTEPRDAKKIVKALKQSSHLEHYMANDLLRASGLALLPTDDHDVAKDLLKVKSGTKLSPVLLVRGTPLWVADGYHRICASYHLNEDEVIPCRIVDRSAEVR